MIPRRAVLVVFGSALAAPFGAFAQAPGKKAWRIGYLSPRPGMDTSDEAFRRGLTVLGYVEGRNLGIDWRFSKGNTALLPALAAGLVQLNPDCLVTTGIAATQAAAKATTTIPIVMGSAEDDPVQHGLIKSLARPGGNVTGLFGIGSELVGKRLELLKEAVPNASRMAVIWEGKSNVAAAHLKEAMRAAPALGIKLQSLEVRDLPTLQTAFRVAALEGAQALLVIAVGLVNSHREQVMALAVATRLPVMYNNVQFVRAGGLMSYAADIDEQFRRAATFVDKIFRGAKPADLPVEQPTKFELVVNRRAAMQIGLTIPPKFAARVDKVIE